MPELEIIYPICAKGCPKIRDAEFLEDIRYIKSVEKIYIKYEEKLTTHTPTRFSCSTVAFYLVHSCMYI